MTMKTITLTPGELSLDQLRQIHAGGVQLQLSRAIPAGATVTVSYNNPDGEQSTGVVQDWVGNDAASGTVTSQGHGGLAIQALAGAEFGLPDGPLDSFSAYGPDDGVFGEFDPTGLVVDATDDTLVLQFRASTLVANPNYDPTATSGLASHPLINAMLTIEMARGSSGWQLGDPVALADVASPQTNLWVHAATVSWLVADTAEATPQQIDYLRISGADGGDFAMWAVMADSAYWGNDQMGGSDRGDTLVAGLGDVKRLTSVSRTSLATVTIEFRESVDVDVAVLDMSMPDCDGLDLAARPVLHPLRPARFACGQRHALLAQRRPRAAPGLGQWHQFRFGL